MRFVMVSPTGAGLVVCVRNAAAAAEDEREALDSRLLTKAFVAAREADELGGGFWEACIRWCVSSIEKGDGTREVCSGRIAN